MVFSVSQSHQLRFYTLPPPHYDYPYLLLNRKKYRELFRRKFDHAIIDSGVMDFIHADITEYPESFLKNWVSKATELQKQFGDKVSFVIPDYPDDYHPGVMGDNVARTVANIKKFMKEAPHINWIPVIQSRYLNPISFLEGCQLVKEVVGDYPIVAIGTICKCKRHDFIVYCCEAARAHFPNSKLHAFGLTADVIPKVAHVIDSFDSMAWTLSRDRSGHSCRDREECIEYFNRYLERLNELLSKAKVLNKRECKVDLNNKS